MYSAYSYGNPMTKECGWENEALTTTRGTVDLLCYISTISVRQVANILWHEMFEKLYKSLCEGTPFLRLFPSAGSSASAGFGVCGLGLPPLLLRNGREVRKGVGTLGIWVVVALSCAFPLSSLRPQVMGTAREGEIKKIKERVCQIWNTLLYSRVSCPRMGTWGFSFRLCSFF